METDFLRIIRRSRRRLRNAVVFLRGATYALFRPFRALQDLQQNAIPELKKLSKFTKENDTNILWLLIGQGLSSWAKMEEALVIIFATLLNTEAEKAGLVLYSIINFNVWLTLIDELFATDQRFIELRPKWNKLATRLRRIKDDRDRLAHHSVDIEGSEKVTTISDVRLRVPSLDRRQKSIKFSPMDTDHILKFSATVNSISQGLVELAAAMVEHATSLEKSLEPKIDQAPPSGFQ